MQLAKSLDLPCGLTLTNRHGKAAMTEQLAPTGDPNDELCRLYARFANGGVGLVITGNVMVHRDHREHPRNVVVDEKCAHDALVRWREAAGVVPVVVQLSHPGRQAMFVKSGEKPVAPSAVALQGLGPMFKAPRALDDAGIEDVIARFAYAAKRC